MFRLNNITL